jgi:hypothetical protein
MLYNRKNTHYWECLFWRNNPTYFHTCHCWETPYGQWLICPNISPLLRYKEKPILPGAQSSPPCRRRWEVVFNYYQQNLDLLYLTLSVSVCPWLISQNA